MSGSIIISKKGFRIFSGGADILIDYDCIPSDSRPDGAVLSCPSSATVEFLDSISRNEDIPVFTSATAKKLINLNYIKYNILNTQTSKKHIDELISCRQRTKNTLRKNGIYKGDILFYGYNDIPGVCAVCIKTQEDTILYVHGGIPWDKPFPHHDTLIINCNKKAPVESVIQKMPKIIVAIDKFANLYDVLHFFNDDKRAINTGIDDSVIAAACEYLKLDCTVFSKHVKPLSSFDKSPKVIITSRPENYEEGFILPAKLFSPRPSLEEIYALALNSNANQKFAFCSGFNGIRKRGNLTLCGNNVTAQL